MTRTEQDAVMTSYVKTVIQLLLGNRAMKSGVAVTAGDPVGPDGYIDMAHRAILSNTDFLNVEFGETNDGGFGPTALTVIVDRDSGCHVETGCKLWLSQSGNRAVILPRPSSVGHFRFSPRELIHRPGKPAEDLNPGIARAEACIARRMRSATPINSVGYEVFACAAA